MIFKIVQAPEYNKHLIGETVSIAEAALFLWVDAETLKQRSQLAQEVSARGYTMEPIDGEPEEGWLK